MKKDFNKAIRAYSKQLKRLLESKIYPFNLPNRANIPAESGIYAIYEHNSDLLYIGISSNLRRRLFGDHVRGDRQASAFRRNLSNDYEIETEAKITNYLLKNCVFKYMTLSKPKYLEHFTISVLKPKLNR